MIASKQEATSADTFDELQRPLYDQSGELRVAPGKKLTLPEILSVNWLVRGIKGSPRGALSACRPGDELPELGSRHSDPPRGGRGDAWNHEALPRDRGERRRLLRSR